jgi:hypothetical protein
MWWNKSYVCECIIRTLTNCSTKYNQNYQIKDDLTDKSIQLHEKYRKPLEGITLTWILKEQNLKIYSAVSRSSPVLALRNKVLKLRWPRKFLCQFSEWLLRNKDIASQRRFTLHFVNTPQKNVVLMYDMAHLMQFFFPTIWFQLHHRTPLGATRMTAF